MMKGQHRSNEKVDVVEQSVGALAKGWPVLLVGDDGTCSFAASAQKLTTQQLVFLIRHSTGTISVNLSKDRLDQLGLYPISNTSKDYGSIDLAGNSVAKHQIAGQVDLIKALGDDDHGTTCTFKSPGRTFVSCGENYDFMQVPSVPSCPNAAMKLCELAGLSPAVVLAEPMSEDGRPFQLSDAEAFAQHHEIPLISKQKLVALRRAQLNVVAKSADSVAPRLQSSSKIWLEQIKDTCAINVYSTSDSSVEVVAIVKGDVTDAVSVPVRVHSECFTGDILGSKRCDCGQQLHRYLEVMNRAPRAVLLYIRGHEGRGIGLAFKINAYRLQDQGYDTVDANTKQGLPVDSRTYSDCIPILEGLGVQSIHLYTNNPEKVIALKPLTEEVVALASVPCEQNIGYLTTKRERLNHKTVLETFKLPKPRVDVSKLTIGLVYTTWNQYYVDMLVQHAEAQLHKAGVSIAKLAVPGAFELVNGTRLLLRQCKLDAVIAIGVLIKGSSDNYDVTRSSVMTGLTQMNSSQDVPILSGVLTCHDESQAHDRTYGVDNPAKAWADAALHMASLESQIKLDKAT